MVRPTGAWFSYNVPFFSQILEQGGYNATAHSDCPRARMFRRAVQEQAIDDLGSVVAFMQYNNRTDPLAEGDACNGISARCDLDPVNSAGFDCFGAIDLKLATAGLHSQLGNASSLAFYGQMAPSWNYADNPPFAWSWQGRDCMPGAPHAGQPDRFNFTIIAYPAAIMT